MQQRNLDNLIYEIAIGCIVDSFRVAARILYENPNYNRYTLYKARLKADDLFTNLLEKNDIVDAPPSPTPPPV